MTYNTDAAGRPTPTPGSPIRLGVIGLGAMGQEMLATAANHPDVIVAHVADLDPQALTAARLAHPQVHTSTAASAVLVDPGLDAVYVATPPRTHADFAVTALERGLAVFCEKPLAISLDDGRRMMAAAEDAAVATAVNYSFSDRLAVLHLEEALTAGEVGDVVAVDIRFSFPQWPRAFQVAAAWLAEPEQGGFLREVLSHYVYLTDRLLGPLAVDHASVTFGAGTGRAETEASGLLRAGGVPVRVEAQVTAGPETYEWILWGSRRSFRLTDWARLETTTGDTWHPVPLEGERGSEATRLSRFVRLLRTGDRVHLASFADALRVQEVVEAFRLGRATGRGV